MLDEDLFGSTDDLIVFPQPIVVVSSLLRPAWPGTPVSLHASKTLGFLNESAMKQLWLHVSEGIPPPQVIGNADPERDLHQLDGIENQQPQALVEFIESQHLAESSTMPKVVKALYRRAPRLVRLPQRIPICTEPVIPDAPQASQNGRFNPSGNFHPTLFQ